MRKGNADMSLGVGLVGAGVVGGGVIRTLARNQGLIAPRAGTAVRLCHVAEKGLKRGQGLVQLGVGPLQCRPGLVAASGGKLRHRVEALQGAGQGLGRPCLSALAGQGGTGFFDRLGQAVAMLEQGASLDQIRTLLRHQDTETTTQYAKVDLGMLRDVLLEAS